MFNNLRRPVPSKAALKVLYQLAYISSGTAVGIATLCTEERRRRVQIAQKIADNAKRIRQSPRYVHNGAAVARREADVANEDELLYTPMKESEEEYGKSKKKEKRARRTARDSDLPSGVDRGYEQLISRDYKRARRRPLSSHRSEDDTKEHDSHTDAVKLRGQRHHDSPMIRRVHDTSDGVLRVYQMSKTPGRLDFTREVEVQADRKIPPRLWKMLKKTSEQGFSNTSDDIKLFFDQQPWSLNGFWERQVAHHLFLKAIEIGTLTEIRSLYRWLLARNVLLPSHIAALSDACRDLSDRTDHHQLFEFYEALFSTDQFDNLDADQRTRHVLDVGEATMFWDLTFGMHERAIRISLPTIKKSAPKELLGALGVFCDGLLAANDASRARRVTLLALVVIRRLQRHRRAHWKLDSDWWKEWNDLRTKIFSSALENGQLSNAAQQVKSELRNDWTRAVSSLERLSVACEKQTSHLTLSLLLRDDDLRRCIERSVPHLSNTAKASLAHACIKDQERPKLESLFKLLCSRLPANLLEPLVEARTITVLYDQWRSTHNFADTWDQYISAKAFAVENGEHGKANATDVAMIDICNAAGRPDRALELLSDLNRRVPYTSQMLSLAAVSLARKNKWRRVKRLLEVLEKSGSFVQDSLTSKCFNNIIHLFSRRHSPADTWKFVSNLMEGLRFSPTWVTTQIVLRYFIREKHLSFVSHWIRYLKTIGHHFEMDARTAAGLMNNFYLEQRPPHVLVMWFCRKITRLSPSLDPANFERVMVEAIVYDLRNGKWDGKEQAYRDLEVLQTSKGHIPKPVNDLRDPLSDQAGVEYQAPDGTLLPRPKNTEALPEAVLPKLRDKMTNNQEMQFSKESDMRGAQEPVGLLHREPMPATYTQAGLEPQLGRLTQEHYDDMVRGFNTDDRVSDSFTISAFHVASETEQLEKTDFSGVGALSGSTLRENADLGKSGDFEVDLRSESPPGQTRQQVEQDMLLAFSQRQYDKVVELYFSSLSPEGLPISRRALELTADASLRLHTGDRSEVDDILTKAGNSGMNVSCAMGPLLLHHMRNMDPNAKRDANQLRLMVMEYYRVNEENEWPVSNHVGVMAANILINSHRPEYGINLLSDMNQSEWVQRHPLDIVAMSVFLKGYVAMRSAKGIKWTMETVLRKKMLIDQRFLDTIKICAKELGTPAGARKGNANSSSKELGLRLRIWRSVCSQRRLQQRHETKVFGRNLVKFIVKLANQPSKATIECDVRREVETQLFGESTSHEITREPVVPEKRAALRRARARIARDIKWGTGPSHEGRRTADLTRNITWLKQYRAFLGRDVVMPDGRLASFRYRLANVPRWIERRPRLRRSVKVEQHGETMASGGPTDDASVSSNQSSIYKPMAGDSRA